MNDPATRPLLLLWGFMGTGKSSVAQALSARRGAACIDLDERIATRAGATIAEIFAAHGEAHFRALERQALGEVLHGGDPRAAPRVVALGGGALLDDAVRRDALDTAFVVTLRARPDTVRARTEGSTGRPLLEAGATRAAAIEQLWKQRLTAYADCHLAVDTDASSVDEVAAAVSARWRPVPDFAEP